MRGDTGLQREDALIEKARRLGASAAVILPARAIAVRDELAGRCRQPRCENYGLSRGCPPHTAGPDGFRQLLVGYGKALFFHIEVPSEVLYSSDNWELFQLLHEVAAGVEGEARKGGYERAMAFAGDSCKRLFCADDVSCRALLPEGRCPFAHLARPSMSGFGIDVGHLMKQAGWERQMGRLAATDSADSTASVCGLVLLG